MDGVTLFVHRDFMDELRESGHFKFHFGSFGWCQINTDKD
jgi:uncharacterized membrane protein